MGQLEGKTAVVTGGSTGIGFAAARRFVAEGARVYLTGRRKEELDAAVTTLGPAAVGVRGDVSRPDDLDQLYATIAGDGRRVDVLFANAGLGEARPLDQVTEEHLDLLLGVHIKGAVFTVQKALPLMNDHASVILAGSIWTVEGPEGFGVYSATKAAVRSFARTWANELKGRGIRVNAVSPGTIETPGLNGALEGAAGDQAEQVKQFLVSRIPLGRIGTPDDVADAVLFLASDQSRFVTGTELFVDGGTVQV
ncbi:SDR family oxidoreductase [Actinoplanes sp. NBRC 103695]|uniref:SDR family NAD(P)-dependent oxidoreductase n=1 Tax=Actinoplanes sp. NBRC 103695 TaxID=3032202 RepID=UPI0024A3F42D|nr:SDR family oxidoreductase [Actinoplanes sp. NBRC 103695]GLY93721.1 oxidoreductase [Actinoplanes sp. NBRC 103695]